MIRLALTLAALVGLAAPVRAEIQIQEVTSPGGITAWLVEEHSIPFTALEIRFQGGTSLDAPGKRGATHLMMGLLEEGAGEYDAQGFAEAVESLAARFDFDSHSDGVTISATFLSENRDQALALLRLAILQPTFADRDLERVRQQVLAGIRSDLKDPDKIAATRFYGDLFGDHPYGTADEGTAESVTALTREDIVAAHKGAMARDRLFIGATGDITAEELGTVLDALFDDLPVTGAPMPPRAEFLRQHGGLTVVDYDTPQSVAVFGHSGIAQEDPDFFAAYILNHVLGGSTFESRLGTEVREKRGLTYGIGTYLAPRDLGELVIGQVASANDRIGEAIAVVKDEWRKLAAEGINAEELEQAQTYLTGAYPLRFDGNAQIAGLLAGMQMSKLPIDYITTRNDKVWAVTLEDVKRVAGYLLKPDELYFVVVGKPVGLESTN